ACGELLEMDKAAFAEIKALRDSLEDNLDNFRFRDALKDAMGIARVGNKYISDAEPWKTSKSDMERTGTILNVCLQICADLAIAFEPFTPDAAERLRKMLRAGIFTGKDYRKGEEECETSIKGSEELVLEWDMLGGEKILPEAWQTAPAELLFEKIEDSAIDAQLDRLAKIRAENEATEKGA
ncbi:MAG: class I tRNA ligase family protein, partial [Rikenellaceae bacterium]|nr:class I tRNA ligase family protein [Rikenellaceae bacterium]